MVRRVLKGLPEERRRGKKWVKGRAMAGRQPGRMLETGRAEDGSPSDIMKTTGERRRLTERPTVDGWKVAKGNNCGVCGWGEAQSASFGLT